MNNFIPGLPRTPPRQPNDVPRQPPPINRGNRPIVFDVSVLDASALPLPMLGAGHGMQGEPVRRRLEFRPGQNPLLVLEGVLLPPALQRLSRDQMATVTRFATHLVRAMQQLNIPVPDTARYLDQIMRLISANSEEITRQFETVSTLEQNLRSLQELSTIIENESLKGNPAIVHMINYCTLHLQAIGDNPLHNFFNANEVHPDDCRQLIENIQSVTDLPRFKAELGNQIFFQLANAAIDNEQRMDAVAQWNRAGISASIAAIVRRLH